MKVTVDTNVLVRAVVQDDPAQARRATTVLLDATLIAVPLPSLCELVWVLRKVYGLTVADVARALRALVVTANVEMDRPADCRLLSHRRGVKLLLPIADQIVELPGRADAAARITPRWRRPVYPGASR